jgi:hypothetical protein
VSEPLRIPVDDLRRAAELLLDHIRPAEGDVIELEQDMFWAVPPDALYDVYQEPTELSVGQLTDSWGNVSKLVRGEASPLSYDLVWLSDVLRAIGHAAPPQPSGS